MLIKYDNYCSDNLNIMRINSVYILFSFRSYRNLDTAKLVKIYLKFKYVTQSLYINEHQSLMK